MKDKEKVIRLLCQISDRLETTDEQSLLINLAVNLGLIYGQAIQVDITADELKFNDVVFGEYGAGIIISNTLHSLKRN